MKLDEVFELGDTASQMVNFSLNAGSALYLIHCLPDLLFATKPVGDFLYFALIGVICKFGVALHKISRFNAYMQR